MAVSDDYCMFMYLADHLSVLFLDYLMEKNTVILPLYNTCTTYQQWGSRWRSIPSPYRETVGKGALQSTISVQHICTYFRGLGPGA